jgi:hypothetical protein
MFATPSNIWHDFIMTTPEDFKTIGYDAFLDGESSVPILNPLIQEALVGLKVGEGAAEIMQAFRDGWHEANLGGEQCRHCGECVATLDFPNLSPWGDVMGYFCDDNCHMSAGEAWDERRLADQWG